MKVWLVVFCLLVHVGWAEEAKTRSWRLTEINAKIAELQKQLAYWQERRRELVDVPDAAPETGARGSKQVYTGPRNGKYHLGPNGKRVYERK